MAREVSQFNTDGVMVLHKPVGISSYGALNCIKKKLRPQRIGHTGTLDPFASGVLLLLFNQATRLASLFGTGEKIYDGVLRLGQATDSGDLTGVVIRELPVPALTESDIEAAMGTLVGLQMQKPPQFSALKHQGTPLYRYARQGITIDKPPRQINIKSAALRQWDGADITFTLVCESGVYVRSWGETLAARLATVGHLQSLRRTANGPFSEKQALSLAAAVDMSSDLLRQTLIPCHQALAQLGLPLLRLDADKSYSLRQGAILPKNQFPGAPEEGLAYIMEENISLVSVVRFLGEVNNHSNKEYETIRVFSRRP
jgi:tRNA pseudouridine55 synthase